MKLNNVFGAIMVFVFLFSHILPATIFVFAEESDVSLDAQSASGTETGASIEDKKEEKKEDAEAKEEGEPADDPVLDDQGKEKEQENQAEEKKDEQTENPSQVVEENKTDEEVTGETAGAVDSMSMQQSFFVPVQSFDPLTLKLECPTDDDQLTWLVYNENESPITYFWNHLIIDSGTETVGAGSTVEHVVNKLTPAGLNQFRITSLQTHQTTVKNYNNSIGNCVPAEVEEEEDTTAPAVPTHLYPANNVVQTTAQQDKVDWSDVTDDSAPVTYRYEVSNSTEVNDAGAFVSPIFAAELTTSEILTPNTGEGIYYWHVKAVDAEGNESAWSAPWKITIDNTSDEPEVPSEEELAPVTIAFTCPAEGSSSLAWTVTNPNNENVPFFYNAGGEDVGNGTLLASSTLIINGSIASDATASITVQTSAGTITKDFDGNIDCADENTDTDTDTDGGSGRSGSRRSSRSGSEVLGVSFTEGEVLGAQFCPGAITAYIKQGVANDVNEVKKLQVFLNTELKINLEVNGVYDAATIQAVNEFQLKYADKILKPWGISEPTGYAYKLTTWWASAKICGNEATTVMPDISRER